MAIQNRRGAYVDLNPAKAVPGELLVVQSGDPNATDGKAVYITFASGDIKMLATKSDVETLVADATDEIVQDLEDTVEGYTDRAETAATSAENLVNGAEAAIVAKGAEVVDSIPSDYTALTSDVTDLKSALEEIEPGLSEDAKIALLNCFQHVAWIDEHGQDYYDDLEEALYQDTGLVRITAVFTQSSDAIYPSTPLNDLKAYLVVTGYYNNGTSKTIIDYSLSGTLEVGTSIITILKDEKTTTFNVIVSEEREWDYEWDWSSGELPEGMTAASYVKRTDLQAMLIHTPNMSFGSLGDMKIEIEGKAYVWGTSREYGNAPQIVISTGNGKGIKLIAEYGDDISNPGHAYALNVNGSSGNVLTGLDCNIERKIIMQAKNGVYLLNIDGNDIEVPVDSGTSQDFNMTGIASASFSDGKTARMVLKSLKYKAL